MANMWHHVVLLLALVYATTANESVLGNVGNHEHRLLNHLMQKYRKINPEGSIRPRLDYRDGVNVSFGLALVRLEYFDQEREEGTFHFWERYMWKDEFMTWNPEDFGGVDHIRLPMRAPIWLPDFVLYNGNDMKFEYNKGDLGIVSSDGTMLYIPRSERKVHCDVADDNGDIYCMLRFGSWTHDGFKLNAEFYDGLENIDVTDYMPNKYYELVNTQARKNVKYYPCCEEPYPDLTFQMQFRRHGASV